MIYIMSFGLGTLWSNSNTNYKKSKNIFSRNKKQISNTIKQNNTLRQNNNPQQNNIRNNNNTTTIKQKTIPTCSVVMGDNRFSLNFSNVSSSSRRSSLVPTRINGTPGA